MLEQGQEVSDALRLQRDLGVVEMFCVLLRKCLCLVSSLHFLCLLHLSQLVHQLLDQSYVEALRQQFQDLPEHVEERRSEFLEV